MSFRFQVSGFRCKRQNLNQPTRDSHTRTTVPGSSNVRYAHEKKWVEGQTWARRTLCLVFCFLLSVSISVSIFFLSACGRKTDVRPPELVAPEPVGDLTLEATDKTIQLHWGRPQKYVDGSNMDDLGGFVVLRATENGQGKAGAFSRVATVPVEDRDRFHKAKKFSYTDEQLTTGTLYRYRVQVFTLDGYYSSPSNTVELAWQGGP
jgi:hypothetical protein